MWGTFKRKALVPNILLLLKALCDALLAVRLAQEYRSPFGYSEDIIAQTCMFTLIIWHNCEVKTVSASRALQFMIYWCLLLLLVDYLTADHRVPDEYLALVMRYSTMSWWPPNAAMCSALHPSLLASRMSAPNFTSSLTSSKLPSITDWCRAVWPSGPNEFTLNSQFVMFCSNECSSLVLPFFTASWKTRCGAEHVETSAWLMVLARNPAGA